MSQNEIFVRVFLSIIMVTAGVRECHRENWALGVAFVAVPVASWLALFLGKT